MNKGGKPPESSTIDDSNGGYESLPIPQSQSGYDIRADLKGDISCSIVGWNVVGEGMDQHTVFELQTQIEDVPGSGDFTSVQVHRRFNDFHWLWQQLQKKYSGYLVPPIPSKSVVGRFQREFINERQRGLNVFLQRVSEHQVIRHAEEVHLFLRTSDEEFTEIKKLASTGRPWFSYFKESLKNVSSNIRKSIVQRGAKEPAGEDSKLIEMRNYVEGLDTAANSLQQAENSLLAKTKDLTKAWADFAIQCSILGQFETKNEDLEVGTLFAQVGHTADLVQIMLLQKIQTENLSTREKLVDQVRLARAMKRSLLTQQAVSREKEDMLKRLDNCKVKLEMAQGKPGGEEQVFSLQSKIEQDQKALDAKQIELETITETVQAEYARFRSEKTRDMKQMAIDLVNLHLDHARKEQLAWESILDRLEGNDLGSSETQGLSSKEHQ